MVLTVTNGNDHLSKRKLHSLQLALIFNPVRPLPGSFMFLITRPANPHFCDFANCKIYGLKTLNNSSFTLGGDHQIMSFGQQMEY